MESGDAWHRVGSRLVTVLTVIVVIVPGGGWGVGHPVTEQGWGGTCDLGHIAVERVTRKHSAVVQG